MKRAFLFSMSLMIGIFWVNASFCQSGLGILSPSSSDTFPFTKNNLIPEDDHSEITSRNLHKNTSTYIGQLSKGQSLYISLLSKGIPQKVIRHIIQHMKPVFHFQSKSRPGDQYTITLGANQELVSFYYQATPLDIYSLKQDKDEKWQATRENFILDKYLVHLSGKVRDSIYAGIVKMSKTKYLAVQFIDIFAWEIDFQKQAKPGDSFSLLVEKYYCGEKFACYGKILAAEYQGAVIGLKTAYRFQDNENIEDYYSPKGVSLNSKAPLNYTRISSGYTYKRLHPILGCVKPHLGIDFAAPLGTPVWAVSDGTVIYQNNDRFNGNQILIKHEDDFISYYNHLSRFADQIQKGDRVSQRQVIGYVGTTGLSTGPHLDYRLKKNGHFINPLKTNFPSKPTISKKNKARFEQIKEKYAFFMKNEGTPERMMIARVDAQSLKLSQHSPLSIRTETRLTLPQPKIFPLRADQWIVPTGREYV